MKRAFLLLITIIAVAYIQQSYKLITTNAQTKSLQDGSLSDIAEEVIAIPLEAAGNQPIEKVNNVRKEGNDLFLISQGTLYRFNRKGEFICRISDPEAIQVAGYVVNPVSRQLIVLGNVDDIYYYSYEGNLIEKKKLKSDFPEHRLSSVAMYNGHIWTTEEHIAPDSCGQSAHIEKQVVEYDSSFRKVNTHKLVQADLGRKDCTIYALSPSIGVAADSGIVYAYSPSPQPDNLLRDTLFLKGQMDSREQDQTTDNILLYPVRLGSRFWVSTYSNRHDDNSSYTFCYDTLNNRSWQVQGGLKDNFFHTGAIPELQSMDVYNQSYCYCKSGENVKKAFPEHADGKSLVLFIVKLKA